MTVRFAHAQYGHVASAQPWLSGRERPESAGQPASVYARDASPQRLTTTPFSPLPTLCSPLTLPVRPRSLVSIYTDHGNSLQVRTCPFPPALAAQHPCAACELALLTRWRSSTLPICPRSLVSRGTCVLAEFTTTSGNFTTVTRSILAKLPQQDTRMSYVYDRCGGALLHRCNPVPLPHKSSSPIRPALRAMIVEGARRCCRHCRRVTPTLPPPRPAATSSTTSSRTAWSTSAWRRAPSDGACPSCFSRM